MSQDAAARLSTNLDPATPMRSAQTEDLLARLPPDTDPRLRDQIAHALGAAETKSPPPPPPHLLEDEDVTFRKPKTLTTPKGKILKDDKLRDAEQWAKRRKEPAFDSSFKYTVAKGFHITLKAVYDKLFSCQAHYVFNLSTNPFDPARQEQDLDTADERQAIKIGSVSIFELDQSQAFSWLQQAFGDERHEIFLNIKSTDAWCATNAYEELSTALGPTTFEERRHTILRLRTELRAKGADISAYKIMYRTVDALRSSGGHWATFIDGSKVQRFTDSNKEDFTEKLLKEFFDVLLQREYDLKGKSDGFATPGIQDKAGGAQDNAAETGHLADSTRRPRQQYTCKYHPGRKVNHTEDKCRENPKNKARQDDRAEPAKHDDEDDAAIGKKQKEEWLRERRMLPVRGAGAHQGRLSSEGRGRGSLRRRGGDRRGRRRRRHRPCGHGSARGHARSP
mmetsp:Transcript_34344/g.84504  ORF Transcript_34344/g.84504 Transcript_34344/m.84504 type:complete len:451 (+) Transcript_34344:4071-5423(+)